MFVFQESIAKFTSGSHEGSSSAGKLPKGHSVEDWKAGRMLKNARQGQSAEPDTADIQVLVQVTNLMSVQINHYQLLFLLRLAEEGAEVATFLTLDTLRCSPCFLCRISFALKLGLYHHPKLYLSSRILDQRIGGSLVVGAVLPQVEVTLVMPSQTPGKESSGGDIESVFPDSSSLGDELIGNNIDRTGEIVSGNVDRASVHFSSSIGHVSQVTTLNLISNEVKEFCF